MLLAAGLTVALPLSPAKATAGFDCSIDDAVLTFSAGGYAPRGIPSSVLGFKAEANMKWPWLPADFKTLKLDDALAQSWWQNGELKLQLYHERQDSNPVVSIELVIDTKITDDEITYAGTYELTFFDAGAGDGRLEKATGKVTCGGE